jgi:hypothetical protein
MVAVRTRVLYVIIEDQRALSLRLTRLLGLIARLRGRRILHCRLGEGCSNNNRVPMADGRECFVGKCSAKAPSAAFTEEHDRKPP